jgi:raffinose/stachyose/melibiose transport system permease protein
VASVTVGRRSTDGTDAARALGPGPTVLRTQRFGRSPGRRSGWWFILPALTINLLVVGIPSVASFGLSLFNWNGIGAAHFIGLQNFRQLFTNDPVFIGAIVHVLKWTAFFLTVPVALGLGSAVLITRINKGQIIYRTILYVPVTIASVVVANTWSWLMDPILGVNSILQAHGLGFIALGWLTDPNIALYSVMFANAWAWWGFLCILFLTGLSQIDEGLYEAARVDGATQWMMFRRITLPLLRPTLVFVSLLTTLWSFTTFDYPYVMTQGGPAHATDTLATWMYFNLINYSSAGYASAIAVCTTGFLLVVIAAYVYTRLRGWEV